MDVFGIGLKALKQIIDKKKSFHIVLESLKNEFNLNRDERKRLTSDIIGSLKHFFLLRYEVCTSFDEFEEDDDEIYLLILALFEIRYRSKTRAKFLVIEEACRVASFMELRFNEDELKYRLQELANKSVGISKEFTNDIYKYNSLFFNIPPFLLNKLVDDYGDKETMNILMSFQKHQVNYLSLNIKKKSEEEYLNSNEFVKDDNASYAYQYISTSPFSKTKEAMLGYFFSQDLSLQMMLEDIEYFYGMKMLHVHGITASLSSALAMRTYLEDGKIETLFTSESRFRRGKYQFERLGLNNAQAYYGSLKLLKTYCEYKVYDLVFVTPPSSYLGQVRRRPDILVTIAESDIKAMVKREKEYLEEASKYVSSGGELVYSVQSILLDEGKRLIEDFLKKHSEYSLEKERQIYPYEFNSDGLYYAIMRKE